MNKSIEHKLICRVAGHPIPHLVIDYSRHMCGHITDGISIANGKRAAKYVISFANFERAYLKAKRFREQHPPTREDKQLAAILSNYAKAEHDAD